MGSSPTVSKSTRQTLPVGSRMKLPSWMSDRVNTSDLSLIWMGFGKRFPGRHSKDCLNSMANDRLENVKTNLHLIRIDF